jgi:lactam utilization protein B
MPRSRAWMRWCAGSAAPSFHVKPHGALYNVAVRNAEVARAIALGAARWNPGTTLFGLAGSPMLDVWRAMGMAVAGEAFADRRYEPDGTLRSRQFPDALITDPREAAAQACASPARVWPRPFACTATPQGRWKS